MMAEIGRFFVRISAFLTREVFGILRQPFLVLTLILGPFLILLLFGLGFRNEAQPLRTLFVVNESNGEMAQQIESYATTLGPQLVYMGVTDDKTEASRKLLRREVDLVAHVPGNAFQLIRDNKPATIELSHTEIDPFQIDYINVFGDVYVNEINRRVLQSAMEKGQQESGQFNDSLATMRTTVQNLDQALNAEDEQAAQAHKRELERDTDVLLQTAGATLGLVGGIQEAIGVNDDENVAEEAAELLTRIEAQSNELSARDSVASGTETQQEQVRRLGDDLTELENLLAEFQHIDADILVQPFRSKVNSVGTAALQPSDYFAPTVIALLLQHLAVTFGALSIVREHREGTMELFSVAPISAIETLLSKYLSYLLFSGILAVILTLAIIFGLQVPMLGSWLNYSLTLAALIFTSLGYGFVISMMAKTDTEAVQYSMIVLLMSVFFSGAFVNLNLLWEPVRLVSWLIPATYAIQLLQDIMLRGYLVNLILLSVLALVGLVMFGLAWGRLRGAMAQI